MHQQVERDKSPGLKTTEERNVSVDTFAKNMEKINNFGVSS